MRIHPKRQAIHEPRHLGERVADTVVSGMGSWRFIIIQTIIVSAWIALNLLAFIAHWDPYPFILLNLLFSTQAAYASPLILMASNRQASKDTARDNLEAHEVDELHAMNKRQLDILEQQNRVLDQQNEELALLKQHLNAKDIKVALTGQPKGSKR